MARISDNKTPTEIVIVFTIVSIFCFLNDIYSAGHKIRLKIIDIILFIYGPQ